MRYWLKLLAATNACLILLIIQLELVGAEQEQRAFFNAEQKHRAAYGKWEAEHPDADERREILCRATTTPTTLPFRWGVSGPRP